MFTASDLSRNPTDNRRPGYNWALGVKYTTVPCDPSDDRRCKVMPTTCSVKYATEPRRVKKGKKMLNIATWNIRGLNQLGKLAIVEKECEKQGIGVTGLSETH